MAKRLYEDKSPDLDKEFREARKPIPQNNSNIAELEALLELINIAHAHGGAKTVFSLSYAEKDGERVFAIESDHEGDKRYEVIISLVSDENISLIFCNAPDNFSGSDKTWNDLFKSLQPALYSSLHPFDRMAFEDTAAIHMMEAAKNYEEPDYF